MTTRIKYPGIAKACFLITLDNGGLNRDRPEEQVYAEMDAWVKEAAFNDPVDLAAVDVWLNGLSDDEIEIVAAGEESEREELLRLAPHGTNEFFDQYFDEVC